MPFNLLLNVFCFAHPACSTGISACGVRRGSGWLRVELMAHVSDQPLADNSYYDSICQNNMMLAAGRGGAVGDAGAAAGEADGALFSCSLCLCFPFELLVSWIS